MAKFKAIHTGEVQASQFLPPHQIPKGVFNVYCSPDSKIYSGEVWTIENRKETVKSGDWVVQENGNPERFYLVSDKDFQTTYEAMPFAQEQDVVPGAICCGVLEKMDISWMAFDDGTKVMPNIEGYRVNYCPSCGKYVRDAEIKKVL